MKKCLSLYIGTPEDSVESFLFLDLVVGPYEVQLDRSNSSMDGMIGPDFLTTLGDILNTASLFSTQLSLPVIYNLDEIMEEALEQEFSEDDMKNIRLLFKEGLQ